MAESMWDAYREEGGVPWGEEEFLGGALEMYSTDETEESKACKKAIKGARVGGREAGSRAGGGGRSSEVGGTGS